MENKKQRIELSDIFRSHAEEYRQKHKMCPEQKKAYKAIIQCRTAKLGGHIDSCDNCGYIKQAYNSCRNRHCPKCQYVKKAQWVDKLSGNLPPVKHFHVVFTIPASLHKLFYINQSNAYKLLFKAAGKTLNQCAKNPKLLGAEVGAVAILHTWGQALTYHPHIHMIVPAGGLSEDQTEWIPSGNKFFLPVKILSTIFRGILCSFLEKALNDGDIRLPEKVIDFKTIKDSCYKQNWVVYCEKPFSNSESLINYLGNYTHRVAISNNRIISHEAGKVTFSIKDYKLAGIRRNITVEADEFIRRFMQHVLPKGFSKIRYFGFMALCNIQTKLSQCFDLIENTIFLPVLQGLTSLEVWRNITGNDPLRCPKCKKGILMPLMIGLEKTFKTG